MRTKIETIVTNHRKYAGTDWPITYTLYVEDGETYLEGPTCQGICDAQTRCVSHEAGKDAIDWLRQHAIIPDEKSA